jgi:hypothetical protein
MMAVVMAVRSLDGSRRRPGCQGTRSTRDIQTEGEGRWGSVGAVDEGSWAAGWKRVERVRLSFPICMFRICTFSCVVVLFHLFRRRRGSVFSIRGSRYLVLVHPPAIQSGECLVEEYHEYWQRAWLRDESCTCSYSLSNRSNMPPVNSVPTSR